MGIRYKKENVPVYFCDVCKREDHLAYGAGGRCQICDKLVCWLCSVADPSDDGDYPIRYCHHCWDLGKEFREEIVRIEQAASEKTDVQIAKWRAAAARNPDESV